MKTVYFAVCLILFSALQTPFVFAKEITEFRLEADQHYQQHDFKKAYKIYYKLAKSGDHYSQDQISGMYANGEGKNVDLNEAYAWSVLAAENGSDEMEVKSHELLQQITDRSVAEKKAEKLIRKYGEDSLRKKADKRETMKYNHKSGGCTGSRLGCS